MKAKTSLQLFACRIYSQANELCLAQVWIFGEENQGFIWALWWPSTEWIGWS